MDFLKKNFDDFNIQARIIPALIIALPLYVYVLMTGIINFSFIELMKKSIFSAIVMKRRILHTLIFSVRKDEDFEYI